jgi:hypothetical protein
MRKLIGATFAAVLVVACAGNNTNPVPGPQKACLDAADETAKVFERCGLDYTTNYKAFIQGAAQGDCANITRVCNENTLRSICFHWLENTATCTDLFSTPAIVDPSCVSQFESSKGAFKCP